jgi:hypothetical protein
MIWWPNEIATLTDGLITLRPSNENDIDAIYKACQDPLIPAFTTVPTDYTIDHAIDFVRAPAQLKRAIPSGPIGQQSDEVITMLTDPTRCKILMVTTAAMTPVMESSEVIHELQHTLSMTLLPIVVNKCERDVPVISSQTLDTPLRDGYEYVSARMQAQQTALTTLSELTQSAQLRTHRYVTEGADLVESLSAELVTRIQELP